MNRSNQLPNLEKLFKDDDEQDFNPLGGSNLASIFGTSNKSLDSNAAVKTQKKTSAAKNTSQPTSSSSKTEVILAKAIHAYKLQNGQYTLVGKLGIALTGNISTKTYLLILYKNNREHISLVTLTTNFKFSIQENNYASYYDGNNDNWSILFDNNESSIEFAREIGLSKYFLCQGKTDESIFYQDLTISSNENRAKEGDNVHLKFSIITSISQPLKVSSIPVQDMVAQISTDDNWERSLLDVTEGLKRILILSPSKQISLGPGFPRDKDIALEIEITDIVPPDIKKSPSSKPHTSGGKASLISRMAKMGQSMLPQKTLSTTDSEDTEEEIHVKSPRRLKSSPAEVFPKTSADIQASVTSSESQETSDIMPANVVSQRTFIPPTNPSPHGALVAAGTFTPTWPTAPISQQYITTVDGQLYSFPTVLPPPTVPSAIDPNANVFLAETRTHNAEIRMGMSRIADNIQKLLDKFHVLEVQNAASPSNEKALETSLKMLLALNTTKNNEKISEIVDTEKNSKTKDELYTEKEKVQSLEDALRITKNSLVESVDKLRQSKVDNKHSDTEKLEMKEKIQKLESSLSEAHHKLQQSLIDLKTANDLVVQYQKDYAKLEEKFITFEASNKILSKTLGPKKKDSTSEQEKSIEIKQIMNKMYQTLVSKFTEDSYKTDYIKTTIANTIRTITLQCLKEKSDQEEQTSDSAEIKDIKADETRIIEDSTSAETEDDTILLPVLDKSVDLRVDVGHGAHEPPPIPPMDLDVDNNWLP